MKRSSRIRLRTRTKFQCRHSRLDFLEHRAPGNEAWTFANHFIMVRGRKIRLLTVKARAISPLANLGVATIPSVHRQGLSNLRTVRLPGTRAVISTWERGSKNGDARAKGSRPNVDLPQWRFPALCPPQAARPGFAVTGHMPPVSNSSTTRLLFFFYCLPYLFRLSLYSPSVQSRASPQALLAPTVASVLR
jgi:hypothetical protein